MFHRSLVNCFKISRYRSSHQRCSIKKGVLRNFTKFTGKPLCQSLFFNKVACLRPGSPFYQKKRLWHRCFSVNFVKFLRIPFLQNTSGRLLLQLFQVFCLSWYLPIPLKLEKLGILCCNKLQKRNLADTR